MAKWGLYPWFEEHGNSHIHPDDLQKIKDLMPYCLVFKVVGTEGNYIVLQYADDTYRVKSDLFQEKKPAVYDFGQKVKVKRYPEKECFVREIAWHYKEKKEFYFLFVDGKKKSRRYWPEELDPA